MRTLGVVKESDALETRVAMTPEVILGIIKDKHADVLVEQGAGLRAGFSDQEYLDVGAKIVLTRDELFAQSEYLVAVNGHEFKGASLSKKVLISLFDPYFNKEHIDHLRQEKATAIALEMVPRISRAQSMDVLSSQANIAGYVAVLMAATKLTKVIPLLMTAAGTIKPAKILVVGAGVAGLSAIATAKRLGAVVFGYDVRAVVKEQVESLGARFVEIKLDEAGEGSGGYAKALSDDTQSLQRERLALIAKDMDIVVTTAQIPGKKAPLLLDERVFKLMKKDSVIVDMAASSGGNVASSVLNEWVQRDNVTLFGGDNLARRTPRDASFTFAKNIRSLLDLVFASQELNFDDEIFQEAVICHNGAFVNKTFSHAMSAE